MFTSEVIMTKDTSNHPMSVVVTMLMQHCRSSIRTTM